MQEELPTLSDYLAQVEDPLTTGDRDIRQLAHSFEMQRHRMAMKGVMLHKETALVLSSVSCSWVAPFRTMFDADDTKIHYLLVIDDESMILSHTVYQALISHPIANFPPPLFTKPSRL